jgi:hypothetical protein
MDDIYGAAGPLVRRLRRRPLTYKAGRFECRHRLNVGHTCVIRLAAVSRSMTPPWYAVGQRCRAVLSCLEPLTVAVLPMRVADTRSSESQGMHSGGYSGVNAGYLVNDYE